MYKYVGILYLCKLRSCSSFDVFFSIEGVFTIPILIQETSSSL